MHRSSRNKLSGTKKAIVARGMLMKPTSKSKGKWKYLYRAISEQGNSFDFYLPHRRNAIAAKRFFQKLLKRCHDWQPHTINTDKNPAFGVAINKLKLEGKLLDDVVHRQVKYLNNRLESDHGKLKRLIHPARGFQLM